MLRLCKLFTEETGWKFFTSQSPSFIRSGIEKLPDPSLAQVFCLSKRKKNEFSKDAKNKKKTRTHSKYTKNINSIRSGESKFVNHLKSSIIITVLANYSPVNKFLPGKQFANYSYI